MPAVSEAPFTTERTVLPFSVSDSRRTCQFAAALPLTPTPMSSAGRHDTGPVTLTEPADEFLVLVVLRSASRTGTHKSRSEFPAATDQTAKTWPLGVVAKRGSVALITPPAENRTIAACRVSGRLVTAMSLHS